MCEREREMERGRSSTKRIVGARLHHGPNNMISGFCGFRIRSFFYGMLLVSPDFTVPNVGVFRRLRICRGSFGWSFGLASNSYSALWLLELHRPRGFWLGL